MTGKDRYNVHRFFDKWAGSAILFLLGLVFRKRPVPKDIRSVLLVKGDGIGDTVMVTAVAQDLRAAFPGVEIQLLVGPFNHPFSCLLKDFDRIIRMNIGNPLVTIMELRRHKPDVCVDLGEWARFEAFLGVMSGARWSVGFKTPGQNRHFAFTTWRPHRRDQHEIENFRSLVQALGVKTTHMPHIELTPEAQARAAQLTVPVERPFAILHLWSGSATWARLKEWPFDRWRELARWLNGKGLAVYLTGAKADAPRADEFLAGCSWPGARVESLAGTDLLAVIGLVREATVVVSIDTSITHVAGALGTPVLSLHGPSSSKRWGPVGERAEAIDSTRPGCGYMNWGADSNRRLAQLECMEAIETSEVIARVESMLARYAKR